MKDIPIGVTIVLIAFFIIVVACLGFFALRGVDLLKGNEHRERMVGFIVVTGSILAIIGLVIFAVELTLGHI